MNDSNAMRKRLVKYVGPVTLLAFAFNIVKFFEATVEYRPLQGAPPSAAASGENDTLAVVSTGAEEAQLVTRSANNHLSMFKAHLILFSVNLYVSEYDHLVC